MRTEASVVPAAATAAVVVAAALADEDAEDEAAAISVSEMCSFLSGRSTRALAHNIRRLVERKKTVRDIWLCCERVLVM
jgi:hypothetical protein